MPKFFDLTAHITPDTVVFPGDPGFSTDEVNSFKKGDSYKLCHMHMGNHMGTHIDFPAHVIEGGKTSSDYPLDALIGNGIIVELPESAKSINAQFVAEQNIHKNDFVFFKTSNSKLPREKEFSSKFVYLEPDAAKVLVEKGVKIVGIDYLSIDNYEAEDLPVHQILLSNEVLIVEGLQLTDAPAGRCKLYILPVKVANMDGLPVRAFMETLDNEISDNNTKNQVV